MSDTFNFRGVFTIPPTPFDEQGTIDKASLRRTVDFCVNCQAHGIVYPVNASEFSTLTDAERQQVGRLAIEQTAGRTPVVIGVTGVSTQHAVFLAQDAADAGADAVIAMPPFTSKNRPSDDELFDFYAALATAVDIPVIVQNWAGHIGTTMSGALVARMCQEIEGVDYIKEETANAGRTMTETFALGGDAVKGIMGGAAGRWLMDEFNRGACGTMPACEATDVHVQLWELLEGGNMPAARAFYNRLLPLLNYESLYGFGVYKEVLYRRGIIATTFSRTAGAVDLDPHGHAELDAIMVDLEPLFRV